MLTIHMNLRIQSRFYIHWFLAVSKLEVSWCFNNATGGYVVSELDSLGFPVEIVILSGKTGKPVSTHRPPRMDVNIM